MAQLEWSESALAGLCFARLGPKLRML